MLCEVGLVCWVVPGDVVGPSSLRVVCSGVEVVVAGDDAGWLLVGVDDVESPVGKLEIVVVLVANIAPG